MINFELYKIFYYVATHRNISRTAELLYISQPAVSKSIRKLESLTNCTLFIRSQKGVTLTSEGQILYDYIQKAFFYLHGGEQAIERINRLDDGNVRIGISNTLCKYCLFPHLETFHQAYPQITIQITNQPSPVTCHLLEQGSIDFGIISVAEPKPDFRYTKLMTIHDIFVSNRPGSSERISVPELSGLPLMLMEKENQTRIFADEYMRRYGVTVNPWIEVGSMEFLVELARIGIGTACVIREFVAEELKSQVLFELPLVPAPEPREVGVITKSQLPLSKASARLIEHLEDAYTNIPSHS